MLGLSSAKPAKVAVVGAHCDDIAIGAGGTLLSICHANPGVTVHALVMTGGETERADEEIAALTAFCPGADLRLTILSMPDGRLPAHWDAVKSALEDLCSEVDSDLLIAPQTGDAHQDHRLVAELVPTAFRGHSVLGYEIVKWDGDLGRPTVYQRLDSATADRKVELLHQHYATQRHRPWYDRDLFLGLARIRGVECGSPFAEAFYINKLSIDLAGV